MQNFRACAVTVNSVLNRHHCHQELLWGINGSLLYLHFHQWHCFACLYCCCPRPTQLGHPFLVGAVSISESWGLNRHTTRCTSSVSIVLQCKLVSDEGLSKYRSSPLCEGLMAWEELFVLCIVIVVVMCLLGCTFAFCLYDGMWCIVYFFFCIMWNFCTTFVLCVSGCLLSLCTWHLQFFFCLFVSLLSKVNSAWPFLLKR